MRYGEELEPPVSAGPAPTPPAYLHRIDVFLINSPLQYEGTRTLEPSSPSRQDGLKDTGNPRKDGPPKKRRETAPERRCSSRTFRYGYLVTT